MVGLISINYKIAPLDVREKFYFDSPEKIVFNNLLKKKVGCEGLMIISTCNRTEIYFEFENHVGEEKKFLHAIVKELVEFKKFKDSLSPYLNNYTGSYDVANHLFRLVSGLESMIIGEFQIVEQLKEEIKARYRNGLNDLRNQIITSNKSVSFAQVKKNAVSVRGAVVREKEKN